MKTFAKASVLLVVMTCAAISGRADTVTVDENGNGFFTATPIPLPVVAGPFGPFLTYALPFPVTQGTVSILPAPGEPPCPSNLNNGACDEIIFQANTLTFV